MVRHFKGQPLLYELVLSTSPCYIDKGLTSCDHVYDSNDGVSGLAKSIPPLKSLLLNHPCIIFVDITEGKQAYQYPEQDPILYPASNALSGPYRCSASGYTQTKTRIAIPWWSVNLKGTCAVSVLTIAVKGIKIFYCVLINLCSYNDLSNIGQHDIIVITL